MKKNNLIRFVQSLVLLPVLTTFSAGGTGRIEVSQNVLAPKQNIEVSSEEAANQAKEEEDQLIQAKAEAIDAYFRDRGMPLEGKGRKMVEEAEKNGLDWRLIAAISVRESTGGIHGCKKPAGKNNPLGWGSCKIPFESYEQAIEVVARNLGGNNPRTAYHYKGKDTVGILRAYNPPSIVPKYAEQVISIMNKIGAKNLTLAPKATAKDA